jgi:hypothetical protein
MSEQWFTVRVEDSGDGLLINEDDATKYGLQADTAYTGYFLPDGNYRLRAARRFYEKHKGGVEAARRHIQWWPSQTEGGRGG